MKRSFLLLEVVIGIALLVSIAAFLFQKPILFLKQEKEALEVLAKASLYQKTIDEIKLAFFQNDPPLIGSKKQVFELKESSFQPFSLGNKKIKRYYKCWEDPQKEAVGALGQKFNLLHLQIAFDKPVFTSSKEVLLFVQKIKVSKASARIGK